MTTAFLPQPSMADATDAAAACPSLVADSEELDFESEGGVNLACVLAPSRADFEAAVPSAISSTGTQSEAAAVLGDEPEKKRVRKRKVNKRRCV